MSTAACVCALEDGGVSGERCIHVAQCEFQLQIFQILSSAKAGAGDHTKYDGMVH